MSTSGTWRGDDFPSWLSPMIVKELRQGVQSGMFAWTFVGLQGAMFLLMAWATISSGDTSAAAPGLRQMRDFLFWIATAFAVTVVVPSRALGSISGEQAGNTIDLVRLTRLSATRIVLGKWLAILAQCALVVVAILPYVVLRYFFGGVNVVRDLEAIGWLFAASTLAAAAALALSAQPLWIRIAAGAGGAMLLVPAVATGPGPWSVSFGWRERLALLLVIGLYCVVLLEYAAARIAPAAENHALRKRGLALAVAAAWLVASATMPNNQAGLLLLATLPIVLLAAIEALVEPPNVRPGPARRAAALLFSPGWASGVVFAILLAAVTLAGIAVAFWRFDRQHAAGFPGFCGTVVAALVFPLPFVVHFSRRRHRLLMYLLVQLVCFMVFVFVRALTPYGVAWENWDIGWTGVLPFPLAALSSWLASSQSTQASPAFVIAAAAVTTVVLASVGRPWRREMGMLEPPGRPPAAPDFRWLQ